MSKNSRQINYRLRIAKSVERKMFCSTFQKLSVFHPLEDYKYIGFGALYFADFYLIHRQLGVKNMLSIEKSHSKDTQTRYNFNKPFKCIDIEFKPSSVILPRLKWVEPSIVWLDYTSVLNDEVLSDLDTVLKNVVSGSFIIISVNADAEEFEPSPDDDPEKSRLDFFIKAIGKRKLPRELKNNQITNLGLPKAYAQIISKEIETTLFERNSGSSSKEIIFEQLFSFKYKDGKPMYTFGGLVIESDQKKIVDDIKFDELHFIRRGEDVFEIEVPNLTFKEIKFLESLLPGGIDDKGKIKDLEKLTQNDPKIPEKDIVKFAKIYQYFPTFAETNLG